MKIFKEENIKVKSITRDNEILQIISKKISLGLASDALGEQTYDNDMTTCQFLPSNVTSQSIIYVTDEVIGKNIHMIIDMAGKYTNFRSLGYIIFYNGNIEIQKIEVSNEKYGATRFDRKIGIPQNTEKIVFSVPNGDFSYMYIYEINLAIDVDDY